MRVVVDGLPISGMSLAIVVEHLLAGWESLGTGDELHLVLGSFSDIDIPSSVHVHRLPCAAGAYGSRLRAQTRALPRICREVGADVMLGVLPTTCMARLPCPKVVIAHDVRHELRPEQFPIAGRLMRKFSYDVGFRQAAAIACVSERTRNDLRATHPRLRANRLQVVHWGADHVKSWSVGDMTRGRRAPYAIAFGQYSNKNVDLVVDAWARHPGTMRLYMLGLSDDGRREVEARAAGLGVSGRVVALPWIGHDEFRRCFAGASLVVFPSDFEGFGLPALEALYRGIPVVISRDAALLEVTDGHAAVMASDDPAALAAAMDAALRMTSLELAAAQAYARTFTWAGTARRLRRVLAGTVTASDRARDAQPA